jgi:outer membrane receptor protein involved in Fe transport
MSGRIHRPDHFLRMGCAAVALAAGGAFADTAPGSAPVDLPAQPLAQSLKDVARQTGADVLFSPAAVAGVQAPAIKGAGAETAVSQLIGGTRLEMIRDGSGALIVRQKAEAVEQLAQAEPAPSTAQAPAHSEIEEIVVTARKRAESIAEVPVSITAFTSETLSNYNIQSFNDYATKTPGLSFSYGGGPTGIADARSIAIRGITGQNLFGTASAVGFYIDDTPVPASIDPRVLDVDHIEVLKGPQGTLYGESSLAGNVRIITKKPDLDNDDFGYMAQAGLTAHGGSPDGGGAAVANIVLAPSNLAIRAVAFYNHDAGYLTRTYPDPNSPAATDPFVSAPRTSVGDQGAVESYGGSVSALWRALDDFDVTLRVMYQDSMQNGFNATFAPLPSFTPDYTLDRAFNVQPQASDRWVMPSIDLDYKGNGWELVNSTSYFYRHTADLEDSTYGTIEVFEGSFYGVPNPPKQPYTWVGNHGLEQVSTETRLTFDPIYNISGTVGVFYSNSHTKFAIPADYAVGTPTGPWPANMLWFEDNPGSEEDVSLFGELYYKFLDKFQLTLGAREYWLTQTSDYIANGFFNFGLTPSNPEQNSQQGLNPKVSLSYQATDQAMVYFSASKGFRAGGAQLLATFCALPGLPANDITQLKSDTLWTYEGGTKIQLTNPGLLITAAGYHIDWSNIQQQVALPCGYYFDINGGTATINGGELEIAGKILPNLQIRLGANYEDTALTDPGALGLVGLKSGSRILGVPAWQLSLGGVYTREITDVLTGFVSADYSFTGNSLSLLNGGSGLEGTRPSYSLVDMKIGADWGKSELSLNIHNLTNEKPNLGDIGYIGYAQFNRAGTVIPQVATLQPLTVTLQYKWNF